jgi:hypothetical protein
VAEGRRGAGERGQATIEWIGLLLLASLLLVGLLAAAARVSATDLARVVASTLICAVRLSDACSTDSELVAAYGPELAAVIAAEAPQIVYEEGMTALPVDFRTCRGSGCGNGPDSGAVWATDTGEATTAFVHVVDCRGKVRTDTAARRYDCTGERSGKLYIQYWLYYEDSTSLRALPGGAGSHEDDWEGYQVRIGPGGTDARATSHHGYNYEGGMESWLSDAGLVHRSAWGSSTGRLYVSGGSHAGHVREDRRPPPRPRWTPPDRLTLTPIETLDPASRRTRFAVVPPWRKPVYHDPEDQGT